MFAKIHKKVCIATRFGLKKSGETWCNTSFNSNRSLGFNLKLRHGVEFSISWLRLGRCVFLACFSFFCVSFSFFALAVLGGFNGVAGGVGQLFKDGLVGSRLLCALLLPASTQALHGYHAQSYQHKPPMEPTRSCRDMAKKSLVFFFMSFGET